MNRSMRAWKPLGAALLMSALPLITADMVQAAEGGSASKKAAAAQAQAQAPSQPVDPEALKALNRMGGYLRTLSSFQITLNTTQDAALENGQKVQLSGTTDYKVRRPGALLVTMRSDRKDRDIYYDGKSLTIYAPRAHFYTTIPAPATIKETLRVAYDQYGIELPLEDLFRWGTPEDKHNDLKSGVVVGPAKIDGKDTDQYAFRQGDIDWQIWIQRGDKPLPVKAVISSNSDPASPTFSAAIRWNIDAKFADAAFTFKPPADAKPITIARADR